MHITRLDIDNFGPFFDRPLDGLSPGLTVLHGPNEAGKSATRAFIRAVFFGFLHKNETDHDFYTYRPARGGNASGSITVRMSNGAEHTVYRKEGPNRGPVTVDSGGTPPGGGPQKLDELLGRIGPELFQSVFSVSLAELQSLENLNKPQIRDRIYSVGLGLSKVSLPDALERLDKELKDLRSPRAGRTRTTEKEIADLRAQLDRARADAGGYAPVIARRSQLEREITQRDAALAETRARRERQKQLLELRPHWERMQELERQVAATPDVPSFPANGEQQLDDLIRQLAELEKRIQEGDLKQDSRSGQLRAVPVVEAFSRIENDVRRLCYETEQYRKGMEDLPLRERELHEEQTRMARDLELLGPDWTEQRVVAFKWPEDFRAQMDQAARNLGAARDGLHAADTDVRGRTDAHQQAAESLQRAVAARDALQEVPPESIETLESRGDKLRRIRMALAEESAAELEKREIERRLAEGLARVQPEAVNSFIFGTYWFGVLVIALSLAAIGYGFWQKQLPAAIPGGLTLVAGIVTLAKAILTGKGMKTVLRRPEIGEANDVLKKQAEGLKARAEAIAGEIGGLTKELKLPQAPNARSLEESMATLERALERRRNFESLAAHVRDAEARVKSAEVHENAAAGKQADAKSAATAAQEQWQGVLFSGSLRPELDPSQAASVMGAIQSAKGQQKIVASLRERVLKITETVQDIETRLAAALEAARLPHLLPGQATPALLDLDDRYKAHLRAVERAERIEDEMKEWRHERDIHERRHSQFAARRTALLGAISAQDETEFRTASATVARRRDLLEKLADLKISHPLLVNEVGRAYRETLARLRPEEMQPKLDAFEEEARQQEEKLRALHTELGQVNEQKRAMEDSNPAGDLQGKLGLVTERLREEASRWAVLTVARDMLECTREQFQRERQPALLQAASRYFQDLTLGRYSRVETVVGEDRFEVVEGESRRKPVTSLSTGTAQQLYLAMRFALIEEYSRNAEPLPVVMDDVLVNFDPERASAACSAVLGLAEQFQVIFLTCHPQTVECFRRLAPRHGGTAPGAEGGSSDPGQSRTIAVIDLPASAA